MKKIINLILIILLLLGLNYLRAGVLAGKIKKTNGVMERFYNAKWRQVEIEDDKAKSKYIRNKNLYELIYEEKDKKPVHFYYDSETDNGYSLIDDLVKEIDKKNLYLENEKKKEKTTEEIDKKIKETKDEHEKNKENAKDIKNVEKKEEKENKEDVAEKEEIKSRKKTFVETYDGPLIVEDFVNNTFFVFNKKDKEKNENIYKDLKGNYLITDAKTDYVKEIKYKGKKYKYFNYKISEVEQIKMPKLK